MAPIVKNHMFIFLKDYLMFVFLTDNHMFVFLKENHMFVFYIYGKNSTIQM